MDAIPTEPQSPVKLKNDVVYEGEWSTSGVIHGKGIAIYPDGRIYEGSWKDGVKSGKGRLVYANGDYYDGDWLNDLMDGHGKLFEKSSGVIYEGWWVKGV